MNKIIKNIDKHNLKTATGDDPVKQQIKKEREMDAIAWNRNTNVEEIWKEIQRVAATYRTVSPLSDINKMKWVTKNAPKGYQNCIRYAPMKLKIENKDNDYEMTFNDLINEVNEQYEVYQADNKSKTELSLLNQDSGGRGNKGKRRCVMPAVAASPCRV